MSGNPTVISLFAGTGGSSLGYKWAGYKELLAIDFDSHAVECFQLNFPEVPIWKRDITEVSGQEILDFCNIKKGELDVLDGSPPCQGFSTAGKRQINDPRNELFQHYVRLIKELEPKVFVMENVPGMAKGKMKGRFIEIMKTLKALPYQVTCREMNAMHYGVPQSRKRLIFIGASDRPRYPKPLPWSKSVLDVWPEFVGKIVCFRKGKHDISHRYSSPLKPAPTIPKCGGHIEINNKRTKWPVDVAKRLCSFPDEWILIGNNSQKYERLGNAVMPKFMQAIAETIKKEILT